MIKYLRIYLFFMLLLALSNTLHAGKIKRAFEALSVYNYFKAKVLFEKKWEKNKTAAWRATRLRLLLRLQIVCALCTNFFCARACNGYTISGCGFVTAFATPCLHQLILLHAHACCNIQSMKNRNWHSPHDC
jgi:hypothetical protein